MPLPGVASAVLTARTLEFLRASLVKARILLRISPLALAFTDNTCALSKPRSLLRRYFNCPYTTQVQISMIMEMENCTTTSILRKVELLEPLERLPFRMSMGLNFER